MEKKEKKETSDLTKIARIGLIMFVITAVVLIVMVIVSIRLQDVERDGYAVISLDGYTDTINFTKVCESGDIYIFYLVDGGEIQCHRDRVVIYYDEDKE